MRATRGGTAAAVCAVAEALDSTKRYWQIAPKAGSRGGGGRGVADRHVGYSIV